MWPGLKEHCMTTPGPQRSAGAEEEGLPAEDGVFRGSQPSSESHQSTRVVKKYCGFFLPPSSYFLPEHWLNQTSGKAEESGALHHGGQLSRVQSRE